MDFFKEELGRLWKIFCYIYIFVPFLIVFDIEFILGMLNVDITVNTNISYAYNVSISFNYDL